MTKSCASALRAPFTHILLAACALTVACALRARAQEALAAPVAPPQATPPRTRANKLPPLSPRPGYLIGRAVFTDGRPIPDFTVRADSVAGSAGSVQASNGRYALRISDPLIYIVQHVRAYTRLTYQGQNYVLYLHPMDGIPDDNSQKSFRGDVKKGVVRDFVFRLTGIVPGYESNPPPPTVTTSDSFNIYAAFEGCPLIVQSGMDRGFNGKILITLTPTAPLADGSQGTVIRREFPNAYNTYLYDIPLGVYNATARSVDAQGALVPLHVQMRVYGTPITSGDTPQSSVTISFPPDTPRATVSRPTLTVTP